MEYEDLPAADMAASAEGAEPNQREMKLRFWGADDCRCSGDWADCFDSPAGKATPLAPAVGGGGDDTDTDGDCGSNWEGTGSWGVLGLELPVEAPLGGTMGDWEPEEGLWPLAGPGEPKLLLRDSKFSRNLH